MVAFEPVVCVSEIERTAVATDALGASQALAELSADDALGAAQVTLDDDAIVLHFLPKLPMKNDSPLQMMNRRVYDDVFDEVFGQNVDDFKDYFQNFEF